MAMEYTRAYCPYCDRKVRADRKAFDHKMALVVCVMSCGLFVPIYLLAVLSHHLLDPYRCQVCNEKV